ncbi:hypothetical protein [Blastopirellula marina]|uniref:Uncharacterized protein n=1 Tax=Blastopirellula marina TaxID=124 RepID=A0A2S8GT85_9BACT|nr:hypothetical protein [Blastopirellula marina]PQO47274.1 hypothetical protein C5Y93_04325 [Blastopirellula marina]
MRLRDLAIYADQRLVDRYPGGFVQQFHRETCCVVELYLSHLTRKVETNGIAKAQLTFSESLADPPPIEAVIRLDKVIVAPWPFDFAAYKNADDETKKRAVGTALCSALLWLGDLFEWEKSPFENAFAASENAEWIFEGYSKRSWVSPSGEFRAKIFFRFEISGVELFATIFRGRSKQEIARRPLGKAVPEMGCLSHLLQNAKWKSETTFSANSTDVRRKAWHAEFPELR